MKTAYELAMERLNQSAPQKELTDAQRAEIAELNNQHEAKMADLDLQLGARIREAEAIGDGVGADTLRAELAAEKAKLQSRLEDRKEAIRNR